MFNLNQNFKLAIFILLPLQRSTEKNARPWITMVRLKLSVLMQSSMSPNWIGLISRSVVGCIGSIGNNDFTILLDPLTAFWGPSDFFFYPVSVIIFIFTVFLSFKLHCIVSCFEKLIWRGKLKLFLEIILLPLAYIK